MRTPLFSAGTAVLLSLMTLQAHAEAPPIKPGLWEVTPISRSVDGKAMPDMSAQMIEQMKKLPPEVRAKMEEQMKSRGLEMASGSGGQMAVRMCLSKEMLDRQQWQKSEGHCKNTSTSQSGSTWSWKFSCTQPPSEGEGTTVFTSNESYDSDVRITSQHNGKPQVITMKHKAKWLGADCGKLQPLKPVEPPAKP